MVNNFKVGQDETAITFDPHGDLRPKATVPNNGEPYLDRCLRLAPGASLETDHAYIAGGTILKYFVYSALLHDSTELPGWRVHVSLGESHAVDVLVILDTI